MFAARYSSVCRNCRERIKPGEMIFPVAGRYAHAKCPPKKGKPVQLTLPFKKEK